MSLKRFSFVLPTKNRAYLLDGAINSLLDQTLEEFEVVVIDNDDSEETCKVLAGFLDPRIRYIRTGGLGMPQNWQVGLDAAVGEWVLFIEDKWRVKKNLLELLSVCSSKYDPEVISWKVAVDGRESGAGDFYASAVPVSVCDARRFLGFASRGSWREFSDTAPRMANCAARRSLLDKLCLDGRSLLCRPVSPDYTSGYFMLGAVSEFVHLDSPLVSIVPNAPSTGDNSYRRAPGYENAILEMGLKIDDTFSEVPAKYFSLHNSLMNDFIRSMKKTAIADRFPLHLPSYFRAMADEAIRFLDNGVPFSRELELLRTAYGVQPTSVKRQILSWNFSESLRGYSGCPDKVWTRMAKAIKRQFILAKGIL